MASTRSNGKKSGGGSDGEDVNIRLLRSLVSVAENRWCFDCSQPGPTYVNMTIGAYVCTRCSGTLRGLIPPHRVKSITMAKFTDEELDFIKCRGNEFCRQVWLARQHADKVYTCNTSPDKLAHHMSEKYEKQRWYQPPTEALHEQARQQAAACMDPASGGKRNSLQRVGSAVRQSSTMPEISSQISPQMPASPDVYETGGTTMLKRPSINRRPTQSSTTPQASVAGFCRLGARIPMPAPGFGTSGGFGQDTGSNTGGVGTGRTGANFGSGSFKFEQPGGSVGQSQDMAWTASFIAPAHDTPLAVDPASVCGAVQQTGIRPGVTQTTENYQSVGTTRAEVFSGEANFANFADFTSPQAAHSSSRPTSAVTSPRQTVAAIWPTANREPMQQQPPRDASSQPDPRQTAPPVPSDKYAALLDTEEQNSPSLINWNSSMFSPTVASSNPFSGVPNQPLSNPPPTLPSATSTAAAVSRSGPDSVNSIASSVPAATYLDHRATGTSCGNVFDGVGVTSAGYQSTSVGYQSAQDRAISGGGVVGYQGYSDQNWASSGGGGSTWPGTEISYSVGASGGWDVRPSVAGYNQQLNPFVNGIARPGNPFLQ